MVKLVSVPVSLRLWLIYKWVSAAVTQASVTLLGFRPSQHPFFIWRWYILYLLLEMIYNTIRAPIRYENVFLRKDISIYIYFTLKNLFSKLYRGKGKQVVAYWAWTTSNAHLRFNYSDCWSCQILLWTYFSLDYTHLSRRMWLNCCHLSAATKPRCLHLENFWKYVSWLPCKLKESIPFFNI